MPTILVDLDGTIVDSAPGIIASYRHALATLGVDPPAPEELRWVVGPPSRLSFPKILGPGGDVERAVELYRSHYRETTMLDARVFPGMAEALRALRALPAALHVCTAKPEAFAREIVAHVGLEDLFEGIYGADFEGRFDDKGLLIGRIIEEWGIDPARTVMVGDRTNDVVSAARHAIPCVGVLWGYGGTAELTEAGVAVLCETPGHLPGAVRGLLGI